MSATTSGPYSTIVVGASYAECFGAPVMVRAEELATDTSNGDTSLALGRSTDRRRRRVLGAQMNEGMTVGCFACHAPTKDGDGSAPHRHVFPSGETAHGRVCYECLCDCSDGNGGVYWYTLQTKINEEFDMSERKVGARPMIEWFRREFSGVPWWFWYWVGVCHGSLLMGLVMLSGD